LYLEVKFYQMKIQALFFSLFLLPAVLLAQPEKDITSAAKDILSARASGTSYANTNYAPDFSYPIKNSAGETVCHVYNFKPAGYVILATGESMYPLIGYSFDSNCPQESRVPGFQYWMDQVVYQHDQLKAQNIPADTRIRNAWKNIDNPDYWKSREDAVVEPLLHTQWDQGKYYNTSCPEDPAGPDDHALTGCVATALGQLMYYFRHPQQGTGYYGYTDPTYGFLEVDFSEQHYNWDAMGLELNAYNPQVADLLHHIGVSVDMQYGPDGSGMNNHKGAYTLHTYFGYADSTTYLFRDSLDESFDWSGMLIEHLDQDIPLYYAGWGDTVFQSGHAFIADGYQDSTYFHFNWGWGGSADGYFNLNSLTPSGADFTLLHEAIANATPDISSPNLCTGQKVLTNMQGSINDGSGPLFNYGNNQTCEWLIQPDDSTSHIEIDLLEFTTDPMDELIVFDGPDDSSPVLSSFSGNETAQSIESTSDQILIRFISDNSLTEKGFLLAYNAVQPDYCSLMTSLTDSTGTITDGSNDYLYQNQTYCNWNIQPEGANNFVLSFSEFDLEEGDYLRIMDATNNTIVATLSSSAIPDNLHVSTDKLNVTFNTDNGGRAQGFSMNYAMNASSVKDYMDFDHCELFPNPASNNCYVEVNAEGEPMEIALYTISGKCLHRKHYERHAGIQRIPLDIKGLSNGLYFVEIASGNKKQRVKLQLH
ncbi:MAG TPA: C10 family peptidase, partial [Bacteroidales bacterium]|nr:C10 family peptidase [Bacteroidales bacterium]